MPPNTTSNDQAADHKSNKTVLVVKRPKRKRPLHNKKKNDTFKSKPGLPNLTKELTEPPPDENDNGQNDDDALFGSLDDTAIPCDTLLAFQSLAQTPHTCLTIPLRASFQPIPCVLASQLYPVLNQHNNHSTSSNNNNNNKSKIHVDVDPETLAMVTQELEDLFRKNTLRRLTSIQHGAVGGNNNSHLLSVLVLTDDYGRGVWDAYDSFDDTTTDENRSTVQRMYVQWFVDHLKCWTGRLLVPSQMQETWLQDPPRTTLGAGPHPSYLAAVSSLSKCLEYLQQLQVIMPNHHHGSSSNSNNTTTYQLWLPEWGQVLSTLNTADKKLIQKLQFTYQKEVSEQSFLQQPFYKQIPSPLLLQWMLDQGKVQLVPKPFGNFIKLNAAHNNSKKRKR